MAIRRTHIDDVFKQKFTFHDRRILEDYFRDGVLNEETRTVLQEQWEQFDAAHESRPNLDPVYYKLYYQLHHQKGGISGLRKQFRNYSRIAAVFAVGLLVVAGIYVFNHAGKDAVAPPVEFVSHTGFRNQFRLPDGTSGWLGYGSVLKYHTDDRNRRIVELNGLAYFDVVHQKKQPFVVQTPAGLDVEVLGTKFNVSSYEGDHACEVILEQGRVRLQVQGHLVGELCPNERVVYHSANHAVEKLSVDVSDYVAWKDGKLVLHDVSLEEACLKLGRFYNVEFEIQTRKADDKKVRLVLEDESLENALKLLTMITSVQIRTADIKVLNKNSYSKRKIIIK